MTDGIAPKRSDGTIYKLLFSSILKGGSGRTARQQGSCSFNTVTHIPSASTSSIVAPWTSPFPACFAMMMPGAVCFFFSSWLLPLPLLFVGDPPDEESGVERYRSRSPDVAEAAEPVERVRLWVLWGLLLLSAESLLRPVVLRLIQRLAS